MKSILDESVFYRHKPPQQAPPNGHDHGNRPTLGHLRSLRCRATARATPSTCTRRGSPLAWSVLTMVVSTTSWAPPTTTSNRRTSCIGFREFKVSHKDVGGDSPTSLSTNRSNHVGSMGINCRPPPPPTHKHTSHHCHTATPTWTVFVLTRLWQLQDNRNNNANSNYCTFERAVSRTISVRHPDEAAPFDGDPTSHWATSGWAGLGPRQTCTQPAGTSIDCHPLRGINSRSPWDAEGMKRANTANNVCPWAKMALVRHPPTHPTMWCLRPNTPA